MEQSTFKEEVRQHFDARADRYDRDTERCDQQDFVNFETVIPYIFNHGGERILEVATGTGIILDMLLKAGKDAYGLDFAARLLSVAESKRGISRERLYCGDAERLPFPDQSFDSTCVFRSLHHIENPHLVLLEMARCSRKNVFVYDSAGRWRRLAKKMLQMLGLYQPLYSLLRGHPDSGYRPACETEGPVRVFYAEDAISPLKSGGFNSTKVLRLDSSLFIHAQRRL